MGQSSTSGAEKSGMTVVRNEKNELITQRRVTGWRTCIDYRKLNKATRKDHFPLLLPRWLLWLSSDPNPFG
jgi:hypothetical protein